MRKSLSALAPFPNWRRRGPVTGFLIFISSVAFSQTPEESRAIMVPIHALFAGMSKGDSAMVHSAFLDQVSFVSVYKEKNGKPVLRPDPLQDFLRAVGKKHDESWNEPIWDEVIQVDGIMAQVWAKYAFYVGKKFSHCGVDTFQLLKGQDGTWKIFHLADTRRTEGCDVPEKVSSQFK